MDAVRVPRKRPDDTSLEEGKMADLGGSYTVFDSHKSRVGKRQSFSQSSPDTNKSPRNQGQTVKHSDLKQDDMVSKAFLPVIKEAVDGKAASTQSKRLVSPDAVVSMKNYSSDYTEKDRDGTTSPKPDKAISKTTSDQVKEDTDVKVKVESAETKKPVPAAIISENRKKFKYISKRIAKAFEVEVNGEMVMEIFFGTIARISRIQEPTLWLVKYDDNDKEEFDMRDVTKAWRLYTQYRDKDPQASTNNDWMPKRVEYPKTEMMVEDSKPKALLQVDKRTTTQDPLQGERMERKDDKVEENGKAGTATHSSSDELESSNGKSKREAAPRKFVVEDKEPDNEAPDSLDDTSYSEKKPSAKKARIKEQQEADDLRKDLLDIWPARSKRKAAPRKFVLEDKESDNEAPDSPDDASYSAKKPSRKKQE
jgi:hypothetical protein